MKIYTIQGYMFDFSRPFTVKYRSFFILLLFILDAASETRKMIAINTELIQLFLFSGSCLRLRKILAFGLQ